MPRRGRATVNAGAFAVGKKKPDLVALGHRAALPETPEQALLERVPNPHPDTAYVARFTVPEFTSLCPITGQPDFAHLVIDYVPKDWLVESKSLKLYLASFRNHGAFHEDCTVAIGKRLLAVCLFALLLSIAVRSLGGLTVPSIHKGDAVVLWGLVIAALTGKALGGVIADWLGWIEVSILALLLSAPLLSFLVTEAPLAVAGMLLFQMTMPVTLLVVYRVFPDEPGFAFGLTTLALLIGGIPLLTFPAAWFADWRTLLGLLLASAAALAIGLPPVLRKRPQ